MTVVAALVRRRVREYTVQRRTYTVAPHDNFYWIRDRKGKK